METTLTLAAIELELMTLAARKRQGLISEKEMFDALCKVNLDHWIPLQEAYPKEKTALQAEICKSIYALEDELGLLVTCPY